ncbi:MULTISPECIES: phage baseplate protein [Leptospira]|uniref:Dit-like phage tail protein N-terminal domain-containing protein n=2 Tax=Leptospira interrogans TaxID=173 RepID=A0A0E2D2Q3_LEPIR|nr:MULTISPECIES: hypothetical protein [Leptospira]EMP09498.1 hypothetical protein LEP1GSC124_1594 [Leptospira interrogans serovar Pyrogenes str. 200701872]EKR54298.1 hypothetical protein LEP1GSC105_2933 [Leptospira interrogans str. UI 12758]KGE25143.1 hypothetical protein IQ65_15090 [Leptospira interrogans serovar Lai]UML79161.1 hypothetical protein FH602_12500 [Leptospira kirschneri]UML80347.1 hypothetical protein FH602_19215 [Leptospira kirschneri]
MSITGFFTGRETLGITGVQDGKTVTINLNVTTAFSQDYPVIITQHPIEKDPTNTDTANISDHVIPSPPTISLVCVVSSDVGLTSITSTSEKLKTLIYWQRVGSIVKVEGYGTGGLINSMISLFGMSGLFDDDIDEPLYLGLDDEVIENLAIGNIRTRRETELGKSVEISLELKRIIVTEAQTAVSGATGVKTKGKTPTNKTDKKSSKKVKSSVKEIS